MQLQLMLVFLFCLGVSFVMWSILRPFNKRVTKSQNGVREAFLEKSMIPLNSTLIRKKYPNVIISLKATKTCL